MGAARKKKQATSVQQLAEAPRLDGFLRPSSVDWLAQHAWWLVAGLWLLRSAFLLWVLDPSQDLLLYFRSANAWSNGQVPYRDFPLEYPPGALLIFALPRFFTDHFLLYQELFSGLMLSFDLGIVFGLWRMPAAVLGEAAPSKLRRYDSLAVVAGYLLLTAILGTLCLGRFDLAPALLICGFVLVVLRRPQSRWLPELLLALGIYVKLVPGVLFLPFAALRLAQSRSAGGANALRWWVHSLLRSAVTVAGFLAVLCLPFYLPAGSAFWKFFLYHRMRGLQLESLYSSVFMLVHRTLGVPLSTEFTFGATHITGPGTSATAAASTGLLLAGQVAVGAWFAVRLYRAPESSRNGLFVQATLAQLLAFLLLGKVFSPQYLAWIAPLCALSLVGPTAVSRVRAGQMFALFGLTWLILRFYYSNLCFFDLLPVLLLLVRNALVLVTLIGVLRSGRSASSEASPARRPWHRVWPYATAGVFLAWAVVAGLTDETDCDVFVHMKVAEDLLRSWTFPTLDVYSATAAGRPFVAHEWLSGVVFLETLNLFGPDGLSWLVALLATCCTGLMFFTLPKPARRSFLALPLLVLSTYFLVTRVHMRPHLFSLLLEALLMLALERWRVTRSWPSLLGLIPMQALWVNLHGGALLAPALVGVVLFAVVLCARFPWLQSAHPDDAPFTWEHARQLALLELGLLGATLLNPYGVGIFPFAINLGAGPDYLKRLVTEWRPTLHPANHFDYWYYPYLTYLAVLAGCLLLRRRERPLIDLFLALVLASISLRARRFVGDFAVLALPVLARSVYRTLDGWVERRFWAPQHGLNLALTSLLLATTARYELSINPMVKRPLGLGFGGDLSYDQIALLKKSTLHGAIMNDYEDGALMIHELSPNLRPVMDSRIDIYGAELVEDWIDASLNAAAFAAYADEYGVNVVMKKHLMLRDDQVFKYLQGSPEWQRVEVGRERYMFVRKEPLGALGRR